MTKTCVLRKQSLIIESSRVRPGTFQYSKHSLVCFFFRFVLLLVELLPLEDIVPDDDEELSRPPPYGE